MRNTGINWKVRFNKDNMAFILRFVGALFVPILIYMGMEVQDLTSWEALGVVLIEALKNPYIVGFTIVNAINLIPDPTTAGLSDSERAMGYTQPGGED